MEFNLEVATNLLKMFGGEDANITVAIRGEEIIGYHTEYPEEGSVVIGKVPK